MFRLKLLTPEPWMVHGLCRQIDPDLWFADKTQPQFTKKARNICRLCPVRIECADYAIDNNEPHGVWGGLSAQDRKMLRRSGGIPGELAS